ncbi:MAG: LuxR C-terminal-related transcriptional regulator [Elainellaceae cyanobacterium]
MSAQEMPIRVLIVASSAVVQAGIEAMVTRKGNRVVGCGSTLAALKSPSAQHSDVAIIDAALLAEEPLEMLTTLADELAIALWVDVLAEDTVPVGPLLQAGIRGILTNDLDTEGLILALEAIVGGLVVLHPEVAANGLEVAPTADWSEGWAAGFAASDALVALTPRESEILHCLATGLGNKAIARQLNISDHTVKFHVSSIFSKLNVSSRTEAVTTAMRQGLIFM